MNLSLSLETSALLDPTDTAHAMRSVSAKLGRRSASPTHIFSLKRRRALLTNRVDTQSMKAFRFADLAVMLSYFAPGCICQWAQEQANCMYIVLFSILSRFTFVFELLNVWFGLVWLGLVFFPVCSGNKRWRERRVSRASSTLASAE